MLNIGLIMGGDKGREKDAKQRAEKENLGREGGMEGRDSYGNAVREGVEMGMHDKKRSARL